MKNSSSPSTLMALARIAIGVMFLFFAEYKLASTWFAREGYAHWVSGFAQNTAVGFYRPFLNFTLRHHWIFGYATAVLETLIGLSMVSGYLVRQFSLLGALFMANLVLCSWVLPAGTAPWRYLGNQLDNIPLLLLFLVFYAEDAGVTLGLDGRH